MPGIAGLITRLPRVQPEGQLRRMMAVLHHGPGYRTGTWVDEESGVYAGWTVRGNSSSGGAPISDGEVTILGYGDPLPHSISPAGLNGRFHGLLADRRTATAQLFNDRYGLSRLYYYEAPDAFYFACEAKAILAVRPELRTLDHRGLGELLCCGCVLDDRTLFAGLRVLPPASSWRFRHGALGDRSQYFHPREWEQDPLAPEAFYRELRDLFPKILPGYFENGATAISLTGGLDTRMIMAWLRAERGSLRCYSFGGMYRDSQDVRIARRVARECGQPHEVIPVGREFLADFASYAERTVYLTDGSVSVRHAPDLYVNERAAQIAPVRLTGNYGGEALRRIRAFKPAEPTAGPLSADVLPWVAAARKTYAGLLEGHPLLFTLFRQVPWSYYGLLALEETQLSVRSPYLDNHLVRLLFRAPEAACAGDYVCLRLIRDGNARLARIPTDRGLGGPATARALMEFTIKAEYASDYGMPQWLARIDRAVMPTRWERLFLGRHKFTHFRVWYRDALAPYVQEMLLDPRSLARPYLDRKAVETIVRAHTRGSANHTTAIHQLLTLELIHRLFLDAR